MERRELSAPDAAAAGWKPRLAVGVRLRADPADGRGLLLFPEAALELNATAAAIIRLCDGRRTLAAIAGELAHDFGADANIADEVADFLAAMRARRLVE